MGLDMRPMGKPKPGFEKRYVEIFRMIESNNIPEASKMDKLLGKKKPTKEELMKEWFDNQISTYETLKAPRVGFDEVANEWIEKRRIDNGIETPKEQFIEENKGFYVIELSEFKDGVPVYISLGQDENVFRGKFLGDCEELIGQELVGEAWETKLGDEALDYGKRLMAKAVEIATEKDLMHLKDQRMPPQSDPQTLESNLHIVFSLAKWLIFYGENGHGYEADF